MSKFTQILKAELERVSRGQLRTLLKPTRNTAASAHRQIAEIKSRLAKLESEIAAVRKALTVQLAAAPEEPIPARFSGRTVAATRRKLGLSGEDFGKLIGVTSQAVYNWEQGIAKPRARRQAEVVALRALTMTQARARVAAVDKLAATRKA